MATLLGLFFGVACLATAGVKPSQSAVAAAVRAAGSVHYVWVSRGQGVTTHIVGDASTNEGIQRITISKQGRTGHLTVIVEGNAGYFRGDAFALMTNMKAPASVAAKDAGHWLKIDPSNRGWALVASYVRLDSYWLYDIEHVVRLARDSVTTTLDGRRVLRLNGTLTQGGKSAALRLYLDASGPPVPVEQTQLFKGQVALDIRFSRWGEPLHITVKAHAATPAG